MKRLNKKIGSLGEKIVSEYLKKENFYIFQNNYYCFIGEIDIIAKDNNCICFIEVKSRYDSKYGLPCEAVTSKKQKKIKQIAKKFITENELKNHVFRFDVAEVFFNRDGEHTINYIKNAF